MRPAPTRKARSMVRRAPARGCPATPPPDRLHRHCTIRRTTAPDASLPARAPRIRRLERLVEVEHVLEILRRVLVLLDEYAGVDERKHDLPHVCRPLDAPVLEHRPGHGAEPLQRQIAHTLRQLTAADVARLRQPLEHVVQRGEDEYVRRLLISRIAR